MKKELEEYSSTKKNKEIGKWKEKHKSSQERIKVLEGLIQDRERTIEDRDKTISILEKAMDLIGNNTFNK